MRAPAMAPDPRRGWSPTGAEARMAVCFASLGGDMADIRDAKVPDLGNSSDVPVIEVLVAVGDTVAKDQGLVTLESDKATMEVPSSAAGVVKELKVKLDDKLAEGSVVAILETEAADAAPPAKTSSAPPSEKSPAVAPPAPASVKADTV